MDMKVLIASLAELAVLLHKSDDLGFNLWFYFC